MSEMPKSLMSQASENKVTTKGVVTSIADDKKAVKPHLLNVSRGADATRFLRENLEATKDDMINRTPVREITQGLEKMYGGGMIHHSKLYRWAADYTEFQYMNNLSARLEKTPYKLVKPERGEGTDMLNKYIDASTGQLLSNQKWIKFSDGFIPTLLSSVEVKTSTKIMGGNSKGAEKYINAGYGEKELKRTKGMVGYVHFVQVGSVNLVEDQIKFIMKRVKFDRGMGVLTLQNADDFFRSLEKRVYAGYIITSGTVEILSVAKINAAIRNSLQRLGMLVGVPTSEYPHVTPQTSPVEISKVMYNYLSQFIAEGRANTTDEKQLKVYRDLQGIIINKDYTRSFAERYGYLIRNGDYTEFINKFFQVNKIDFRFKALNESFGIGNFQISQEFIESVRW